MDEDQAAATAPVATPVCERAHRVHWFTGRLDEVLDGLLGADGEAGLALSLLGPEQTAEAVVEIARAQARLDGLTAELLAHAESVDVASHATPIATTTGGWFAHATITPRPAARRTVKQALRLAGERAVTGAALRAGACDAAQAAVVVKAVDSLPEEVGPVLRAEAEAHLLALARVHDAEELTALAKHLHEVIDPEGAEAALAARLAAEEDAAAAAASLTIRDDGKGRTRGTFDVPTLHGDLLRTALEAIESPKRPANQARPPTGGEDGWVDDPTAQGQRISRAHSRGRAFMELLEVLPVAKLPTSGGLQITNVVTMTLDTLLGGLAPGVLDTGTLLSPGEARRLAARHGVIPVVLGTKSEVLDVGSKARLHTKAMRIGLRVQHRTCTVEGCTIPAAWCEAHHKKPWALYHQTNLKDGTLACGPHHRKIHNPAYTVTYDPGGTTHITRIRR